MLVDNQQGSESQIVATTKIVDAESPWVGLQSFDEATSAYFFGRTREIDDLSERIADRHLTVLYGQSGLGKTSLLRAGLIPRLKQRQYLPVFLRLAFDPSAPPLHIQVIQEIARQLRFAGKQSSALETGILQEVSLWQLFHDPEFGLIDPSSGSLVQLVLLFDQFEELGTLGRAKRTEDADTFMQGLACLVENRPPLSLQLRIETDDDFADRLVMSINTVRVLISLRNDYLHWLERWRQFMPSLMDCRLELTPLTGNQAFEAVTEPGRIRCLQNASDPPIIDDETGKAIVQFVGGARQAGSFSEIENTPPILSLLCERLNAQRLASGDKQISLGTFQSKADDVLREFYVDCFSEVPLAARASVEDNLVTDKGNRDDMTVEAFLRELSDAKVPNPTKCLENLVDSRLLTIDHRGGVARLELTHDVLSPIALHFRRLRYEKQDLLERQSREAARRYLRLKRLALATLIAGLVVASILGAVATHQNSLAKKAAARATFEASRANREAKNAKDLKIHGDKLLLQVSNAYTTSGNRAWSEFLTYSDEPGIFEHKSKWHEAVANWARAAELQESGSTSNSDPLKALAAIAASSTLAAIPTKQTDIHASRMVVSHDRSLVLTADETGLLLHNANSVGKNCLTVKGDFLEMGFSESDTLFYTLGKQGELIVLNSRDAAIVAKTKLFDTSAAHPNVLGICFANNQTLLITYANGTACVWYAQPDSVPSKPFSQLIPITEKHLSKDGKSFFSFGLNDAEDDKPATIAFRETRTGNLLREIWEVQGPPATLVDFTILPTQEAVLIATNEYQQPLEIAPLPPAAPSAMLDGLGAHFVSAVRSPNPQNADQEDPHDESSPPQNSALTFFAIVDFSNLANPPVFRRLMTAPLPASCDRIEVSADGNWILANVVRLSSSGGCGAVASPGAVPVPPPDAAPPDAAPPDAAPAPAPAASPEAPQPPPPPGLEDLSANRAKLQIVSAETLVNPTRTHSRQLISTTNFASPLRLPAPAIDEDHPDSRDNRASIDVEHSGYLYLLDLRDPTQVFTQLITVGRSVRRSFFSLDVRTLYAVDLEQTLSAWDIEASQKLITVAGNGATRDAAVLHDGTLIGISGSERVEFYSAPLASPMLKSDPVAGRVERVVEWEHSSEKSGVYAVVISPQMVEIKPIDGDVDDAMLSFSNAWVPDNQIASSLDRRGRLAIVQQSSDRAKTIVWEPWSVKRQVLLEPAGAVLMLPRRELAYPLGPITRELGQQVVTTDFSHSPIELSPDCEWQVSSRQADIQYTVQVPLTYQVEKENGETATVTKYVTEQRTRTGDLPIFIRGDTLVDVPSEWVSQDVSCVSFTSNNQTVAIGNSNGNVGLWDLTSFKRIGEVLKHSGAIQLMSFDRAGEHLLIAHSPKGSETISEFVSVTVWNIKTNKPSISTITNISFAKLALSGKRLLTIDADSVAKLIDIDTSESNIIPVQLPHRVVDACFDSQERMVYVATDRAIFRWKPLSLSKNSIQLPPNANEILQLYGRAVAGMQFDPETGELSIQTEPATVEQWAKITSFVRSLHYEAN